MQYITRTQLIKRFAKHKIGDSVVLIRDTKLQNGKTIQPPLICTVTNIRLINKKAEKNLPKYKRSHIDHIEIDPDLIVYDIVSEDEQLEISAFEYAILPVDDRTKYFDTANCLNLCKHRRKQFEKIIHARRRKQTIKSAVLALLTLSLFIYVCCMVFSKNTIVHDILLSIASIVLPLIVFAVNNRRIERIHIK